MRGRMPHYDLNHRVALITGGARGIGLATARALTARGARVALVDLDSDELQSAAAHLGPETLAIPADVTDTAAIAAAVTRAAEHFGAVDLLIANAGIAPMPATARTMDPDEFERVVEVNLLGVYRTVRAGLEQVIERRGQVVLVSSVYAFLNGMVLTPYAVAKAGVEQLGRALRIELAPHGASATVAYFGFVDTGMVQRILDDPSAAAARRAAARVHPAADHRGGRCGRGRAGDRAPARPGGRASLLGRDIHAPGRRQPRARLPVGARQARNRHDPELRSRGPHPRRRLTVCFRRVREIPTGWGNQAATITRWL